MEIVNRIGREARLLESFPVSTTKPAPGSCVSYQPCVYVCVCARARVCVHVFLLKQSHHSEENGIDLIPQAVSEQILRGEGRSEKAEMSGKGKATPETVPEMEPKKARKTPAAMEQEPEWRTHNQEVGKNLQRCWRGKRKLERQRQLCTPQACLGTWPPG